MLYLFGFQAIGVALSDLYFVDPAPAPGQEGAERGVRVELRFLELGEANGTIYASRPISIGRPIWRADLFESVASAPGSFDRVHHHPTLTDWEPGPRVFEKDLSADPARWLGMVLSDLDGLLERASVAKTDVGIDDERLVREAVPEIIETLNRLFARVQSEAHTRDEITIGKSSLREGWL